MAEGIIVDGKDAQKAGNVVKNRGRAREILTTLPTLGQPMGWVWVQLLYLYPT